MSKNGVVIMGIGVLHDKEFERIFNLPRRPEWTDAKKAEAVALITQWLRSPNGTQTLRPIQARILAAAADEGPLGVVGFVGAGEGKTLATFLLQRVYDAQRVLLLVPAKLRMQTRDEIDKAVVHWAFDASKIRVLSYESLSTVRFATMLEEYLPDLIVADEAHALARPSSARTRRVIRYIRDRRRKHGPESVRFVPLSASLFRKSPKEIAHILLAALGQNAPLPDHYPSLESWHFALAEGVQPQSRIGAGALTKLCDDQELLQGLDGVRSALRRRIIETPGIISTTTSSVEASLIIQRRAIETPSNVQAALTKLRDLYELPNGDEVNEPVAMWAHAREIACGFAYSWDPPGPADWMAARRGWARFCRETISNTTYDSPLQIANAIDRGALGEVPEWAAWRAIRREFIPNPIPNWLSDFLVKDAEEWAIRNNGVVWVGHSTAYKYDSGDVGDDGVGAGFTRIPYFGAGATGEAIRDYRGPCAASIRAHGTGRNLTQYDQALVLCAPSSGAAWEQLLGRHHRPGQSSDEVTYHVYCHTRELLKAMRTSLADARYIQTLSGNAQRLLFATTLDCDGHALSWDALPEDSVL